MGIQTSNSCRPGVKSGTSRLKIYSCEVLFHQLLNLLSIETKLETRAKPRLETNTNMKTIVAI